MVRGASCNERKANGLVTHTTTNVIRSDDVSTLAPSTRVGKGGGRFGDMSATHQALGNIGKSNFLYSTYICKQRQILYKQSSTKLSKHPPPPTLYRLKASLRTFGPPTNHIKQFITLRRPRQVLMPLPRNENTILYTHAADIVIPLHNVPVYKARMRRVLQKVPL